MNNEKLTLLQSLEEKLAANPHDAVTLMEVGKLYKEFGKMALAEYAFASILEIEPGHALAHFELGNVYVAKNDATRAINEYEKALALEPSNADAQGELAKQYLRQGKVRQAVAAGEKAVALDKNNAAAYLGLARVYQSAGEYAAMRHALERARVIAPDNERLLKALARMDEVAGARKKGAPYRVFFTWGMHYECNYRCTYCYTPKPESPEFKKSAKNAAVYPGSDAIVQAWEKIAAAYGSARLRLDGGEPSAYPDFINLVQRLSKLHRLQINTNLSFAVEEFTARIAPERVRLDASLHPEYISAPEAAAKLKALKEKGFKLVASVVAHPSVLGTLAAYKKEVMALGIPFLIHPFSGVSQDKKYPDSYTSEERKIIYAADKKSGGELAWRDTSSGTAAARGKKCLMGYTYARIYPNGDAYRCCSDDGLLFLGNIYQGTFTLLEEPAECAHTECRCWRCMVPGEEERWLATWLDDWETDI